jgi:Smg protein
VDNMKENMLDVLVFLFDNYLGPQAGIDQDDQSLADELEEAGFDFDEITKAFDWLGGLKEDESAWYAANTSIRVFTEAEQQRLDVEARGFLMKLEFSKIISQVLREKILDAVMRLDLDQVTLGLKAFKRIVGLVLMNTAEMDDHLPEIEEMVFDLDPNEIWVH